MERKLSSGNGKLRNLKDFLSSSRSLSQSHIQMNQNQPTDESCEGRKKDGANYCKNNFKRKSPKSSLSVFNLMTLTSTSSKDGVSGKRGSGENYRSRPLSSTFGDLQPYGYGSPPSKSISMYGLAPCDGVIDENELCGRNLNSNRMNYTSSKNLASRIFNNIRSKFRKRGRDRNKIVDSKSTDFGTLFGEEKVKSSLGSSKSSPLKDAHFTSSHSTSLRRTLKSSRSVDNVLDSIFGSRRLKNVALEDCDNEQGGSNADKSSANKTKLVIAHPHLDAFEVEILTRGDGASSNRDNENNLSDDDNESDAASVLARHCDSNSISCPASWAVIPSATTTTPSPSKPLKCLTKELEDLLHHGWYWAGLSKEEAEAKLKGQPDGAFVVRDSSSDHYLLSLSFNSNGRTLHTRIEYRNGQFSFYSDADSFPSVAELIEHCIAYSELGVFCYSRARRADYPTYPVRLTNPISRFTEVKSLMYLSRFVIRQYVRLDLIPHLDLPQTLIDYVSEQRYI